MSARRKGKKSLPRVVYDDARLNTAEYFYEKVIRNIANNQVKNTPQNREWCAFNEGMVQAYMQIRANAVTGTGVRVKCKNEKAKNIIEKFNKKVNSMGQTIEDAISDWEMDNCIHGYASWRILQTNDPELTGIDIARMNPKYLVPITHSRVGWKKFIQFSPLHDEPDSKKDFMKKYRPALSTDTGNIAGGTYIPTYKGWRYVHIPLSATITLNLVKRPLIVPAMTLIVFKKWIVLFMRKAAEKFWSPTLWAKMGTELDHIQDEELYEEKMNNLSRDLANWSIFKSIVTSYDTEIKAIEMSGAGVDYVAFLEYLDEQIVQYILGAISLTKAKGKDLSGSRAQSEVFNRGVQADRHKIGTNLYRLYNEFVLPANGMKAQDDLEIDWSHLKEGSDAEYSTMCIELYKVGGFNSRTDFIKAMKAVFPWLEEKGADTIPKYLKEIAELGITGKSAMPGEDRSGAAKGKAGSRPPGKTSPKGANANKPH